MKINGVVFDLDHTLFDRYATLTAIAEEFCKRFENRLAPHIDSNKAAKLLCDGDRQYIYYGWQRIFKYLCDNNMFLQPPEYAEYKETLLELFTTVAVPYPFTYSVLTDVKKRNLKTGLITNGRGEIQRKKLKLLGLESYFDEIIVCGELGIQKPDAAPFKEMARRLGAEESTLIYVGDNPICDVGGAANAGYITVEVLTASCAVPNAAVGDYRINSVEELGDLLTKLCAE